MKYLLIFFSVLNCTILNAQSTMCACDPETEFDRQARSGAKHEKDYGHYKRKKDTIDVAYIYKWEKQYADSVKTISRNPENPKSQRKHKTPEDTLYTLKGYLWFVKSEHNDCDYHLEIGPKEIGGTRIVVEVKEENIELQQKIKAHLNSLGLKMMGCGTSNSKKAHFKIGIPVVVVGLGFYDVSHKPNTNHGDSHTKKYSWELHPVKNIIFL